MAGTTLTEFWLRAKQLAGERQKRGRPEMPTGIGFIDKLTDGLRKGKVWTIAGRTGSGKTSLALQIGRNIADSHKAVLFISLEMRGEELVSRMYCESMRVSNEELKAGIVDKGRDALFTKLVGGMDFEIAEYGFTFDEILKIIEEYYPKKHPDLIIIDFIQFIDSKGYGYDERMALQEYMRKLAELAKTKNIAIIAVSQFRRPPSGADINRPPNITDLKGTGSLEQLSSVVLIIYQFQDEHGEHYILKVAKNRDGGCGEKELLFNGRYYKFEELL